MSVEIPRWAQDLKSEGKNVKGTVSEEHLPDPFGFKKSDQHKIKGPRVIDYDAKNRITQLSIERAWAISSEPLKSVPMNMIMSYMSGNSLQIIPIMTAAMLVSNPLKSIFEVRSKFRHIINKDEPTPPPIVLAMIMYVVYQLVLMGIGLHKLNSMGLFPNTSSDWLAWQQPTEYKYNTLNI